MIGDTQDVSHEMEEGTVLVRAEVLEQAVGSGIPIVCLRREHHHQWLITPDEGCETTPHAQPANVVVVLEFDRV